MLHLLYILVFTILASIAVANLIRNLVMFSFDSEQNYRTKSSSTTNRGNLSYMASDKQHPELLDEAGNLIKEPLLVMRSINVEDARQKLDALYEASPGKKRDNREES